MNNISDPLPSLTRLMTAGNPRFPGTGCFSYPTYCTAYLETLTRATNEDAEVFVPVPYLNCSGLQHMHLTQSSSILLPFSEECMSSSYIPESGSLLFNKNLLPLIGETRKNSICLQ